MKVNYYPVDEELVEKHLATCTHEKYEKGLQTKKYREEVDEVFAIASKVANLNPDCAKKAEQLANYFSLQYAQWIRAINIAEIQEHHLDETERINKTFEVEKQWDLVSEIQAIKDQIENLPLTNGLINLDKHYYDNREQLYSNEWMLIVNGTEKAIPDYWTFTSKEELQNIVTSELKGYESCDLMIISPEKTIFNILGEDVFALLTKI
jgi:hypothetical protein